MDTPNTEYTEGNDSRSDVWAKLGLPIDKAELESLVLQGVPFDVYERLAVLLDMPASTLLQYLHLSAKTLSIRAASRQLSTTEGQQLCSAIEVLRAAYSLFEGDIRAACQWMEAPVRGLGSKKPWDMLGTRVETTTVLSLIGRLENGVPV